MRNRQQYICPNIRTCILSSSELTNPIDSWPEVLRKYSKKYTQQLASKSSSGNILVDVKGKPLVKDALDR